MQTYSAICKWHRGDGIGERCVSIGFGRTLARRADIELIRDLESGAHPNGCRTWVMAIEEFESEIDQGPLSIDVGDIRVTFSCE